MEGAKLSNWSDYQREERETNSNITGKLRCVVTSVEEAVSKTSGNPMIVVSVRPSGCRFTVKNYIVKNEHFNRNMTDFFDAFPSIGDGNFDFLTWVGAMGAANFGEDEKGYMKIKWWITADKAVNLPPFEGDVPEQQTVSTLTELEGDDGDLPF